MSKRVEKYSGLAGITVLMNQSTLDPKVDLRHVPAPYMVSIEYSGFWSEKNYISNKEKLDAWINKNSFKVTGEPLWARYNDPFTLWFLRRNEILIPVENPPAKSEKL